MPGRIFAFILYTFNKSISFFIIIFIAVIAGEKAAKM